MLFVLLLQMQSWSKLGAFRRAGLIARIVGLGTNPSRAAAGAMPANQTIDRSALGVATRVKQDDPGSAGFLCFDFGCGSQKAFFADEVQAQP